MSFKEDVKRILVMVNKKMYLYVRIIINYMYCFILRDTLIYM